MTRLSHLALSSAFAVALVAPAVAQDSFPDVPANHWAYEALAKLKKDGLLVGYPDGIFRGGRPASRYELAVATHAAYSNLKSAIDRVDASAKALGVAPVASADDVKTLKASVADLQAQLAAVKSYGSDIAAIKKSAEAFEKELKSLEAKKPSVDISGDATLFLVAGNSQGGMKGLSVDGRPTGLDDNGRSQGLTKDLSIFHEAAFKFASTNATGPKWKATVVAGNLTPAMGSLSELNSGRLSDTDQPTDWYLGNTEVHLDSAITGLAVDARVGRIGYKTNQYQFQRIDVNSYLDNDRWHNGEYLFDGAVLGFNFGKAKLDFFGGRNSSLTTSSGVDLNRVVLGGQLTSLSSYNFQVDRTLGLNFNVPLNTIGSIQMAYIFLESNEGEKGFPDRLAVYGANLDLNLGPVKFTGGVNANKLTEGISSAEDGRNTDEHNTAWDVNFAYNAGKTQVKLGYRDIDTNFIAPGDWGRTAILRNPTNVKGWLVDASYSLTSRTKLSFMGEFEKGKRNPVELVDFFGGRFDDKTVITSYQFKLDHALGANLSAYASVEFDRISNSGPRDSLYKWTTFGVQNQLSSNASLKVQYQLSDVNNEFFVSEGGRFAGGYLTTQLSLKF